MSGVKLIVRILGSAEELLIQIVGADNLPSVFAGVSYRKARAIGVMEKPAR